MEQRNADLLRHRDGLAEAALACFLESLVYASGVLGQIQPILIAATERFMKATWHRRSP